MKERVLLTRLEIENRLERGLVGKMLTFEKIDGKKITAKLQRLAVEYINSELLVSFILDQRYEVDLQYFVENITINGDTSGGSPGNVGRLLKGN